MVGGARPNNATSGPLGGPCVTRRSAAPAALPGDELVLQVALPTLQLPLPVGPELPRRRPRVEREVEQLVDLLHDVRAPEAYEHLHPAVEVAVHHVGRADPRGRLTAVVEPEDP